MPDSLSNITDTNQISAITKQKEDSVTTKKSKIDTSLQRNIDSNVKANIQKENEQLNKKNKFNKKEENKVKETLIDKTQITSDALSADTARRNEDTHTTSEVKSFESWEKPDKKENYIPLKKENVKGASFIFFSAIILFILITSLDRIFRNFFKDISRSVLNFNYAGRSFNDRNAVNSQAFIPTILIAIFSFSLFLFAYFNVISEENLNLNITLQISAGIMAYIIIRHLLLKLNGLIFDRQQTTAFFLFNNYIYMIVIGLGVIPGSILLYFGKSDYTEVYRYLSFFVIGIVLILLLFRSFQIIFQKKVSLFYLILYLCILEILPFLVIMNVLM